MSDSQHEVAAAAAKMAPPVAVSGSAVTGVLEQIPLHELVLVATLVYTGLQIYFLLKDRLSKRRAKRG